MHLSLSQLWTSSLWTLWSKAGYHVYAEAVLVVLDNHWRRDDLLLVVKDDWFSLAADLHHLHLAGVWVHGRTERLEPSGVQLLPFNLPALSVRHQLRSWGRRMMLRLDPVHQRQQFSMNTKMGDCKWFLYLIRGWGLWALAWAFTGSLKFFFSYWNTGFFVDATWIQIAIYPDTSPVDTIKIINKYLPSLTGVALAWKM